MAQKRKLRFWLDNGSGTLTNYDSDVNSVALENAVEILDNTGVNEDDVSRMPGIRSGTLPLNGYYNDTVGGIIDVLHGARGTSVSKTWQIGIGNDYFYGEGYINGLNISGDGKALITWSCNLDVDGAVNKTSVSQAA